MTRTGRTIALTAWRATAVSFLLTVAVGGCSSSEPTPDGSDKDSEEPYYTTIIPRDLCNRVAVDSAVEDVGLELAPWHEPDDNDIISTRTHESASCTFTAQTDDERFITMGGNFSPVAVARVNVYDGISGAQAYYDERIDQESVRVEQNNATIEAVSGWWERGVSLTSITTIDESDLSRSPERPMSHIAIMYILYHENLYMQIPIDGNVPTGETDPALEILRDLARAYADEFVAPLEPSG